ncbi:peptidoglycan -binding protein [Celeribacter marinus]|uniref:Flagellar motor rotation protein MotB n=1 Tax=Celeribacter marinus TaxID=1397108 RepID=A0A0P0AAC4_9RHOB|nr:peptidoglycan -binding protein [Celeribacter marinus]ALI55090.1 flagellar motor rotation protein MotB [Celeribacter marinus]SFK06796.1 chemotaxis protein MotB [Celeribacter marinus]
MAVLRRSSQRMSGSIWPGFVDAMTALLLVLMFVLTIFMIMQSMLRDTITGQETELDALTAEVSALALALGLEQDRSTDLDAQLGSMRATLGEVRSVAQAQTALIASLQSQNAALSQEAENQANQIASFEAQVASLLADRDAARTQSATLQATVDELNAANALVISEQEAMQLALAKARDEIDVATEQARLAAARRDAIAAMLADEQTQSQARELAFSEKLAELSAAEEARLVDAAALEALRDKLASSNDELTAMTLALEEARKDAEDTLTLLAAAEAARKNLQADLSVELSDAQKQAALLATAQEALQTEEVRSAEGARKVALLNAQVTELRGQLASLQAVLDARAAADRDGNVQVDALTSRLNAALAQVAAEEKRRAELEEAERIRLEVEAKKLENYRSEFFGRLREILGDRDGVRIVGDRFVFSSEVLFEAGSADLGGNGQVQIARVAGILNDVAKDIPSEIDWVIRVDGHTDNTPLSGLGEYADNWELSQARALSVVRFMSRSLGFPPERLVAAGFGEFQPVASGSSSTALAQNRRIELKLTEK